MEVQLSIGGRGSHVHIYDEMELEQRLHVSDWAWTFVSLTLALKKIPVSM